ncbi:unnamed protein product [Chironomus riparius]|uniref:Uncharacterized protein n=1 Tax=Chironomus riparius TaxID=315576 RepID=A0A9N9RH01_9DIPT|nr:unnamed protein product [Chironomus riparius]
MDKKGTSTSNTHGTATSALSLSNVKSQNSFFVFGNVYVTNQSENFNSKKVEDPPVKNEVATNLNNINLELNFLNDEIKNNHSMLLELKKVLEKREKRKERRAKAENDRVAANVATDSVDFFHPNVFQPRVQEIKSRLEMLNK